MNKISSVLLGISVVFAVIAGVVSIFQLNNLYLAGTQWMLIAIIFAIFAVYFSVTQNK